MSLEEIRKEIRSKLMPEDIQVLQELFLRTKNWYDGVIADRFRAEFVDKRQIIDKLDRNFLVRDNHLQLRTQVYRLRRIALPVIEYEGAKRILDCAETMLPLLAETWRRNGDHAIKLSTIQNIVNRDNADVVEAIRYFGDISGFSGGLYDPSVNDDPMLFISESLWDYQTVDKVLANDLSFINFRPAAPAFASPVFFEQDQYGLSLYAQVETELLRKWIDQLPVPMPRLFRETEHAFRSGLILVPCMGFRALLDMACQTKTKSHSDFRQAVKELRVERKLINEVEAEYLLTVYDFGSAVQHRGHEPTEEEIGRALKVGVSLIRKLYDLDDEVKAMKQTTPPRGVAKE